MNQRGLTVVELLVVIIVSSILMTVVTSFALDYWGNTTTLSGDETTQVSRLNAGDYLRNAIDSTSGLINQNDLSDSHVGNPDPTDTTGTHWIVIHAVPGLVNMGSAGTYTPLIYLNRPSVDTSKNIIMNGTIPYQDDIVLYMNGSTKQLLARTIANPYAPSNRALTSCPASLASSSCPADSDVADNVSGVNMRYFSRSGNSINYDSITDPLTGAYIGPDFPSVEIVEFTVNLLKKANLHNSVNSTSQTVIRVALRN